MICATMALFCMAAQLCGAAESEECRSLGFTGLQLCSDCDTLASYVKDDGERAFGVEARPLHCI